MPQALTLELAEMRSGVTCGRKTKGVQRGGLYRTRAALAAINKELEFGYQDAVDVYVNLFQALAHVFPFAVSICKWMGRGEQQEGRGEQQDPCTPMHVLRRQNSEPSMSPRVQLLLSVQQATDDGVLGAMQGTPRQELWFGVDKLQTRAAAVVELLSDADLRLRVSDLLQQMFATQNKAELNRASRGLQMLQPELNVGLTLMAQQEWAAVMEEVAKCDGWLRGEERFLRDVYTYNHSSAALVFSLARVMVGNDFAGEEYVQGATRDDRKVDWPLSVAVRLDGSIHEPSDEQPASSEDALFDLTSFVVHKGFLTIHGGHYVAYAQARVASEEAEAAHSEGGSTGQQDMDVTVAERASGQMGWAMADGLSYSKPGFKATTDETALIQLATGAVLVVYMRRQLCSELVVPPYEAETDYYNASLYSNFSSGSTHNSLKKGDSEWQKRVANLEKRANSEWLAYGISRMQIEAAMMETGGHAGLAGSRLTDPKWLADNPLEQL